MTDYTIGLKSKTRSQFKNSKSLIEAQGQKTKQGQRHQGTGRDKGKHTD